MPQSASTASPSLTPELAELTCFSCAISREAVELTAGLTEFQFNWVFRRRPLVDGGMLQSLEHRL